jgi:hypothetical protein
MHAGIPIPYAEIENPEGERRPLAELTEVGTELGRLIRLRADAGRDPSRPVAHPSRMHGALKFTTIGWCYSDYSKNGTWINRRRVERGEERRLRVGDTLAFGGPSAPAWRFAAEGAPAPLAHRPEDGKLVLLSESGTLLPDEDLPLAEVYKDKDGNWWIEQQDITTPVRGARSVIAGLGWELHIPNLVATIPIDEFGTIPLEDVTLHLRPVRPESAEGWIEHSGGRSTVFRHEHWAVALALAEHQFEGGVLTKAYVDNSLVASAVGKPEGHLATHFSRIRKDLASAGVVDARGAIDARANGRRFTVRVVLHPPE